MQIPRQALVKGNLSHAEAVSLLKKCQSHWTNDTVYKFFIMNNLSTSRDKWGVYARPLGIESDSDLKL